MRLVLPTPLSPIITNFMSMSWSGEEAIMEATIEEYFIIIEPSIYQIAHKKQKMRNKGGNIVLKRKSYQGQKSAWYISPRLQTCNRIRSQKTMKNHNKSLANLTLNNSLTTKPLLSPKQPKFEGFDRTAPSTSSFPNRVERMKKKPKVDALQDQYVKGLQDEIKYLEMELKLLQEKDMQKHGQVDQLEKFFGDGIPINENILAIKNGFNNYQSAQKKKIDEMTAQRKEREGLIEGLGGKVDSLAGELVVAQREAHQAQKKGTGELLGLVGDEARLRRRLQIQEEELKAVRLLNRKAVERMEKVTRNKLIENMTAIKVDNHKNSKLNSLKESVGEREAKLLELEKQLNELTRQQQEKGYLLRLEETNLGSKKKVVGLQRELDNYKSKLRERQIELQERLKERMVEVQARMVITNKLEDIKTAIETANSLSVDDVTEMARKREIEEIKHIIENNRKISKYTDHYSKILAQLEGSIETMAQRKPEVKSEIEAYSNEVTVLKRRINEEKKREVALHAQMKELEEHLSHCTGRITPLQERTRKSNTQAQACLEQRSRLVQEIRVREKQLQLILVLRGLNFQQVEIARTSNANIQGELVTFLKSWEKIQRNHA